MTPLAITDSAGEAIFTAGPDIIQFGIVARLEGYAPDMQLWNGQEEAPVVFQLGPGASFRGRLAYRENRFRTPKLVSCR